MTTDQSRDDLSVLETRLQDHLHYGEELDVQIEDDIYVALRELRAARLSLTAAEKRQEWQPMVSAPTSGEVLLRYRDRSGLTRRVVAHFMYGGHCIEDHPPIAAGWYFHSGNLVDYANEPLGWMPLPEVPK